MRSAQIERNTGETRISLSLDIDGEGRMKGQCGIGFLDHMLAQLARHGAFDITLDAQGDRHIDDHHLAEDIAIVLGCALEKAAGEKRGIGRYASCMLPMDDALISCALDVSGRPYLAFSIAFPAQKIGTFDTELVEEFFRALAMNARINLHISCLAGHNAHHMAEAAFKALARCLRDALRITGDAPAIVPSTKGVL